MAQSDTIYILPPEFQFSRSMMPRGYDAAKELLPASFWREHSLWNLSVIDNASGRILQDIITPNVVLDVAANAMLTNTWNVSGATPKIFNQICIAQGAVSVTTTANIANGATVTSIPVTATQVALTSGQQVQLVQIGQQTPATQTFTLSANASAGATSLTVTSATASAAFNSGSYVLQIPQATDNPTSVTGAIYSGALSSGAFTGPTGSGTGNRSYQISYQFNGGSYTSGPYAEIWTCNTNPVSATGQCGTHLITVVNSLTSSNSILAKDTIAC